MKITWTTGNLIQMAKAGDLTAVVHGCNCFHTMGSGIAPQLNSLSGGRLLEADKKTPKGNINKLGMYSGTEFQLPNGQYIQMFNLYTQYNYGPTHGMDNPVLIHWESFRTAMGNLLKDHLLLNEDGMVRIGIPYIGTGLANGDLVDFIASIGYIAGEYPEATDIELVIVKWG